MKLVPRGLVAGAFTAGVVAMAATANAETRLFTVRTDQPNVTIVQAVRGGTPLPVAGQNGGDTIFRIDNPAGAVPCSSRFIFTASTGGTIDTTANLCASNWNLTVSLAASGGGGGVGTGGVGIPGGAQPVVIATDDPSTSITNVFLAGREVPITARQEPYVQITAPAGPTGFACSRDLGLALSDGRRIARLVDVCQSGFLVVVPLVGGAMPAPPPANLRPRVSQTAPPPVQAVPQPAPPPPATGPEIIADMQWMFQASADRASFAYGTPGSDSIAFGATCTPASSRTAITLQRSSDELGPGGRVTVRFSAGAFTRDYPATGGAVSAIDGVSHPVIQIATSDPLWPALIKEDVVMIAIGSEAPFGLSLSGSAAKAKQFLAACNPAPVAPPPVVLMPVPGGGGPGGGFGPGSGPGPALMPGSDAIGYQCDDGSTLDVTYSGNSAVVSEFNASPVVLFRAPAPAGVRYVAGLSQLVGEGEQILWTRQGGYTRACVPQ
jgi:hypothetical protein